MPRLATIRTSKHESRLLNFCLAHCRVDTASQDCSILFSRTVPRGSEPITLVIDYQRLAISRLTVNDKTNTSGVAAWFETVSIPTYAVGVPDRNPMFLEKRVYQGSSGAVYPLPVIDRIFDQKQDTEYRAALAGK